MDFFIQPVDKTIGCCILIYVMLLNHRSAQGAYAGYFALSPVLAVLGLGELLSVGSAILIAASLLVIHFLAFLWILTFENKKGFPCRFTIASSAVIISTVICAIAFSPDLARTAFHSACQLLMTALYHKDKLFVGQKNRDQLKILLAISLALMAIASLWIVLMGFSGVVLSLPAPRNWMVFNFYSAGLVILAVDPVLGLRRALYREFVLTDGIVLVDGRDFASLFARGDLEILNRIYKAPGRRANCAQLAVGQKKDLTPCDECLDEGGKATLCPVYRKTYNQILKIKKILETLEVATLLPPPNKMDIVRDGWTLHFFENVRPVTL